MNAGRPCPWVGADLPAALARHGLVGELRGCQCIGCRPAQLRHVSDFGPTGRSVDSAGAHGERVATRHCQMLGDDQGQWKQPESSRGRWKHSGHFELAYFVHMYEPAC